MQNLKITLWKIKHNYKARTSELQIGFVVVHKVIGFHGQLNFNYRLGTAHVLLKQNGNSFGERPKSNYYESILM